MTTEEPVPQQQRFKVEPVYMDLGPLNTPSSTRSVADVDSLQLPFGPGDAARAEKTFAGDVPPQQRSVGGGIKLPFGWNPDRTPMPEQDDVGTVVPGTSMLVYDKDTKEVIGYYSRLPVINELAFHPITPESLLRPWSTEEFPEVPPSPGHVPHPSGAFTPKTPPTPQPAASSSS